MSGSSATEVSACSESCEVASRPPSLVSAAVPYLISACLVRLNTEAGRQPTQTGTAALAEACRGTSCAVDAFLWQVTAGCSSPASVFLLLSAACAARRRRAGW